MSEKFIQESLRFIRQKDLCPSGMKVLIAASGGLDSSVLVEVLVQTARLLEIEVEVAHVDHRTRGLSSEREAGWVKVLAERLQVEAHSLSVAPTPNAAQAELRDLRRQALVELARDIGAGAIATAHHADDNAETFLMRAISGTGSRGLSGIPAKDGLWVRPLLWATRAELEAFARERGLAWVEDPSNARTKYLRNRLRLEAVPLLENIRAGSVRNLARLAERLEEEELEIDAWLNSILENREGLLSLGWLERWPRPLQRRALALWTRNLGLDYDPLLVETLLKGEEIIHPAGSFLRRSDSIVFTAEKDFGAAWMEPLQIEIGRRVPLGSSMAWSFLPRAPTKLRHFDLNVHFNFRDPHQALQSKGLVLDWSKTPWPLAVRMRRSHEDALVDRALKEMGVPRPYWKRWPIVADAQNLDRTVAILGVSVEEEFKPTDSGRCLVIDAFFEERLNALSYS